MQAAVIPFDLTKGWLCLSVFILVGVMGLIHWAMRKWMAFRKKIAFWMKGGQLEGDGSRVAMRDYLNNVVFPRPDLRNNTVLDVEGGFGTSPP
jgi:hypothetical protein